MPLTRNRGNGATSTRLRTARELIESDLYRYVGPGSARKFIFAYGTFPGFRYSVFLRILGSFVADGPLHPEPKTAVQSVMRKLAVLILRRYEYKFGINIPIETRIGPGLFIGHHGSITVNGNARLGKNCNLSQNVTIGYIPRGRRQGYPSIGDRVYVGPGAVISGGIRVGDDVAVGANSVVVEDVPDHSVVAGVPAKVVSEAGSAGYVPRLWPGAERRGDGL
jgi:serine O-acetyltransferase